MIRHLRPAAIWNFFNVIPVANVFRTFKEDTHSCVFWPNVQISCVDANCMKLTQSVRNRINIFSQYEASLTLNKVGNSN